MQAPGNGRGRSWDAFLGSGRDLISRPCEFYREAFMAHREQHGNKEKKKPKQEKNKKDKALPPPFVQPDVVRKPHKVKPQ